MVNNLLIIGGNSDLAKEIITQLNKEKFNIFVISRSNLELEGVSTFMISDYLENINEIESIAVKNNIDEILIFNGIIFEGSGVSVLNNKKILDTFFVNFVVPSSIISNLIKKNKNIRFSVISSIAAAKLRNKNVYYGMSKQALEEYIVNLKLGKYFIFRSGFIYTKLTKDHSPPPFAENVNVVASKFIHEFLKKQNSSVKFTYSSTPIRILFLIFKLVPVRVLNYIEEKFL